MDSRRSLQAILFTDIVASTDRATQLGDRGWSELLQEHHHRVRREIRRFDGREIKALGDGFLASFPRPSQAIRCAWAIRECTRELGLEVRAGIHVGEVEHQGSDLSGIAVHICSRIAGAASPGEVLVSNAVREMETGSGFRFQDRGKHELKGVSGEWRLFALESLPASTASRPGRWIPELTTRRATIGLASILGLLLVAIGVWAIRSGTRSSTSSDSQTLASAAPAIAVLPFRVRGEETEVLREGMVDLLSTGLDEASGIRAINPATLFARWHEVVTEGQEPELSTLLDIARRTGSRYAIIGSAIAVGPGLRLSASVYDPRTAELLGQGQVEGPQDTILQLVDHLTVQILRVILERGEEQLPTINLASLTTDSPVALKAYMEGEVHFRHFDLQAAEEAFKRAVEADSMFALAHYQLANTYRWPTNFGGDPTFHLERAVALSDRLPARERVLVNAEYAEEQQSPEWIDSLRMLVQQRPEDAEAWYVLADSYLHISSAFATAEEIAGMFEHAVKLDPKNAKYLVHHLQFGSWVGPDSTAVAHRVAMFEQVAPRHPLGPAGRLAIVLAFGDSMSQTSALTRLHQNDDFEVVDDVRRLLDHPRYAVLPHVLEDRLRFADDPEKRWVQAHSNARLFWYYGMWHGQLREAMSHLDQMSPEYDLWRAGFLYAAKLAGLPIPYEKLEPFALIDVNAENWQLFWGGVLAADSGRWADHSRAIAEFERRKQHALDESDSLMAERRDVSIQVLRGYGLWRRGNSQRALPILSDPRLLAVGAYGRWRLAQVYQDLGRLEEAEEVYSSFHFEDAIAVEPLAQLQLGKIYEAINEHEKAIQSYEYFVEHWKNADAELQPIVEDARQAVIRVRGLRRE